MRPAGSSQVVERDLGRHPDRNGLHAEERLADHVGDTADRMMVKSASIENSRRISSKPKKTPVIGALNVAEIPPAAPQATRTAAGTPTSAPPGPGSKPARTRSGRSGLRGRPNHQSRCTARRRAPSRPPPVGGSVRRCRRRRSSPRARRGRALRGRSGRSAAHRSGRRIPGSRTKNPRPEPRQVPARHPALLAELGMPGREPGEEARSGTGTPPRRPRTPHPDQHRRTGQLPRHGAPQPAACPPCPPRSLRPGARPRRS